MKGFGNQRTTPEYEAKRLKEAQELQAQGKGGISLRTRYFKAPLRECRGKGHKKLIKREGNLTSTRTKRIRMSKKERLQKRWTGKEHERFKTGRGHRSNDHEFVIEYLRKIHPDTARKITIAEATGLKQDRVLIILNNLSGLKNDYSEGYIDNDEFPFLVYECDVDGNTQYGI